MSFLSNISEVNSFIFDVDGVLTNAMLRVEEDGQLLRSMNTKDGFAMKHALEMGYQIFIITGGRSEGVKLRLMGLGVPEANIFLAAHDKTAILRQLVQEQRIELDRALYMGDDIPDYAPMRLTLVAACPQDAVQEIKQISQYTSPFDGGKAAVRDVIEKVLRVQGQWFNLDVVDL